MEAIAEEEAATASEMPAPQATGDTKCASVACQTEPNLIDRLIDNHVKKRLDNVDLYQEYVRSAQCAQFWPLDKNPIRALVPEMVKLDLPEQYLKNESLMFDLVQAITDNTKLVNLLAKYIHHIVPNVIVSKRIDLIPLITCTIRVCRDSSEQERLVSLLFNLIKRPNEEQRRMILSGIIVVLQASPNQGSTLLLPNLWDHVNDRSPERRVLLAESCAALAHYVRPIMRTNLILSILIQLLKDRDASVRSAACRSFSCLLTLIMDRNDEVFDACLSATEDIVQDVLEQTPVDFCEHRQELEHMRFCALETVYPLLCMWAVKLDRFKVDLAEFYLAKADRYFAHILKLPSQQSSTASSSSSYTTATSTCSSSASSPEQAAAGSSPKSAPTSARRRSAFFESRSSSGSTGSGSQPVPSSGLFALRRQSAFVRASPPAAALMASAESGAGALTFRRGVSAYLKMLNYLVPFVFSDAVHSCAWLSKANLSHATSQPAELNNNTAAAADESVAPKQPATDTCPAHFRRLAAPTDAAAGAAAASATAAYPPLFNRPLNFGNRLLNPTLITDEAAIVAFHDQLEREHMVESLDWIMDTFLARFSQVLGHLSHRRFCDAIGSSPEVLQELLGSAISSTRHLCLLFGRHLTRTKLRGHLKARNALFPVYMASLSVFEPIEQQEFEEIVASLRAHLSSPELNRGDVELLALGIKIIASSPEHIASPSGRQKFLTYILDALVNYANQVLRSTTTTVSSLVNGSESATCPSTGNHLLAPAKYVFRRAANASSQHSAAAGGQQGSQTREFILIIFRHILSCLTDRQVRPTDWAHILVTKFLPLLIALANDAGDVYVCTCARLMCAQLVDTFDSHLSSPNATRQTTDSMLPALNSLRELTEQIKASNLRRQIECLMQEVNEKFYKDQPVAAAAGAPAPPK